MLTWHDPICELYAQAAPQIIATLVLFDGRFEFGRYETRTQRRSNRLANPERSAKYKGVDLSGHASGAKVLSKCKYFSQDFGIATREHMWTRQSR